MSSILSTTNKYIIATVIHMSIICLRQENGCDIVLEMEQIWHIKGGYIVDPSSSRNEISDLYIKDGVIAPIPREIPSNINVIDANGLVVTPGLIDIHVHLRDPGNEAAETIDSGSRAAARGGFTTIVAMPNTEPPIDSPAGIARTIAAGRKCGLVDILPSACITKGRHGTELADIRNLKLAGAAAFTDDGATVTNDNIMDQAMTICSELNVPLLDHALDPAVAAGGVMHDGARSRQLRLPGIPSAAEIRIVERDIRLAEKTGCAVHIQHVSTAESVNLIRQAISKGLRVSGEATPHHIALNDSNVTEDSANFKMNPPVRSEEDRKAIIAGVADGTLQILATDHAPHTSHDKNKGFIPAPFGIVGLETAVGITYSLLVKSRVMSLLEWTRRWTIGPGLLLGLKKMPSLSIGSPANVTILDLSSEWTVNSSDFLSKSCNTPFNGRKLTGRALYTLLRGRTTLSLNNKQE